MITEQPMAINEKLKLIQGNNPRLTELSLRWEKIDYTALHLLVAALETNKHLSSIDLDNTRIDDEGAKFIAEILKVN